MKKKTTEEILAESFQEIASQKNVNKITVNDIVSNCGISSATFYRHFRDKYDLIAWIYGQKCDELFHRFDGSANRKEQIVTAWVSFCLENRNFLVNLIQNTGGYDSFVQKMVEKQVQLIEGDIVFLHNENALTEKVRMKIYLYSSGMVRLVCGWLMGKISASQDEMADVILETVPGAVAPLFTTPINDII
jgi:AcrR family transcriptional regulator